MNEVYLLFFGMVLITVASPGPGVLMTINNAIRSGWLASMHGVVGLAFGAAIMATLCSAGVGVLIRASLPLFLVLKYCGVTYLFYLAYSTWKNARFARPDVCTDNLTSNRSQKIDDQFLNAKQRWTLLLKGTLLQTSNPKSLLFFLSVLPQFAANDASSSSLPRLMIAIGTYCVVLLLVHAIYAGIASEAKIFLVRPNTSRFLSRISAFAFFVFGITMLTLKF